MYTCITITRNVSFCAITQKHKNPTTVFYEASGFFLLVSTLCADGVAGSNYMHLHSCVHIK
jgi:hypothetical protein